MLKVGSSGTLFYCTCDKEPLRIMTNNRMDIPPKPQLDRSRAAGCQEPPAAKAWFGV